MGNAGAVVDVQDLTKKYGRVVAPDHLTLSVQRGQILGFVGPNGAGKTTTIKILVGLARPPSGPPPRPGPARGPRPRTHPRPRPSSAWPGRPAAPPASPAPTASARRGRSNGWSATCRTRSGPTT